MPAILSAIPIILQSKRDGNHVLTKRPGENLFKNIDCIQDCSYKMLFKHMLDEEKSISCIF